MTKGFPLWLLLAALLALGLRSVQLDSRPMHNDEAVNAIKFRNLWEGPGYRYDPAEFHGPTLAYSTLVWEKLTGAGDFARFTEVPPALPHRSLRRRPCVAALSGLRRPGPKRHPGRRSPHRRVARHGLLQPRLHSRDALRVLHLSGPGRRMALLPDGKDRLDSARRRGPRRDAGHQGNIRLQHRRRHGRLAPQRILSRLPRRLPRWRKSCSTPPIWPPRAWSGWPSRLLLFSSFFSNPSGLLDAARTYLIWFQRARGGSPHVHEWSFYWQRLLFFHRPGGPIWSEALILLLAVWAGVAAFARRQSPGASAAFVRFLVFYTVILAAIYTALPYKTPWSALGFWHGAILMAGVGAAALLSRLRGRRLKITGGIVLLTGAAQLAAEAWQSSVNTKYSADPRNPWVYAQTSPNLLELAAKVDAVADGVAGRPRLAHQRHRPGLRLLAPALVFAPLRRGRLL